MSDESYESLSESLSAAMDGEVSSFELRRVLARVKEKNAAVDEQPLEKWQRYHLAQQAIHSEGITSHVMGYDFVSKVSAALADEVDYPAVSSMVKAADENTEQHVWWKPLASMAMAASVTAVVIFGGQQFMAGSADNSSSFQQAYTIPGIQSSKDFVRAQYSNYAAPKSAVVSSGSGEPEVIRLSQGLNRYIDQHRHLLSSSPPVWQTDWLPEGYEQVRHEVMPHAEVMVFSNNKHSVSISIEPLGRQSVPAGVVQSNNIVAVGRATADGFITVVGDVPLMIADRIAASVRSIR